MRLTVDGVAHDFEPIRAFRLKHNLPPDFSIARFEPKDYKGLGRIDGSGAELNHARAAVLNAIPASLTLRDWLGYIPELTDHFRHTLESINDKVGLREVEIEYAAAGFADVCQSVVYARVRGDELAFEAVYGAWLDQTARVSQTVHPYNGGNIRLVTHAYGRAGMIVQAGDETYYVSDSTLGCPAEGYMAALLADVCALIISATR